MATKWEWGIEMLSAQRRNFGNIVGHVKGISDTTSLSAWTAEQFDPKLDWNDVKEIREMWDRKVILKGILDEEDAKLGLNVGADAIIVSNHGGRQLDGAKVRSVAAMLTLLEIKSKSIWIVEFALVRMC